jgi:hypothetical protein
VEVLGADGELLSSIKANYMVANVSWAGPDLNELCIVGVGVVS